MNYHEWNARVADCFSRHAAQGSQVYLTVDNQVLADIGEAAGLDPVVSVRAFCDAVRSQVWVGGHDEIRLGGLYGHGGDGRPRGVAFLAIMVLAASNMGDHELSEINYFTQMRKLLRLDAGKHGRPPGMAAGAEKPLWNDWNRYLQQHGLLSSARQGPEGPTKYIHYPLSQTLLRFADRDKLTDLFRASAYFHGYREPDLLMARVVALREQVSSRLREKLRYTGERYAALTQAVFDLHEEFLASGQPGQGAAATSRRRTGTAITADVFRMPGGFRKPPIYQLLPRWKPGFELGSGSVAVEIQIGSNWLPLEPDPDRPGVTLPVGCLTPEQITGEVRFPLRGAGRFEEVVLPERPFRVLVADPDMPDLGVYASGRLPAPDTHFVFLGPESIIADLRSLRELGKLNWNDERPLNGTGWIEINGGMIIDQDWSHLRAGSPELFNALRPRRTLTVGLSGGLRSEQGFLAGVPPTLTVYGTLPTVKVAVTRITEEEEEEVWAGEVEARKPRSLPRVAADRPGFYRLDVGDGNDPERRLLRIADWDDLRCGPQAVVATTTDPLARALWSSGS